MRSRHKKEPIWYVLNFGILAVFIFGLWIIGLFRFADSVPKTIEDSITRTDAIVVLTGGSGRLDQGLDLLSSGKAEWLFVSGVYQGLDVRLLLKVLQRDGALESRIRIGNAVNTLENAKETAHWVEQNKIRSIRLVTAAYHMPRSMMELRRIMPMVVVIPHPVFPEHVKQARWWAWPGTTSLIVSEYSKLLLVWGRHRYEGFRDGVTQLISTLVNLGT